MNEDMRRPDEGPEVLHAVVSTFAVWHEVMSAYEAFVALNLRGIKLELQCSVS